MLGIQFLRIAVICICKCQLPCRTIIRLSLFHLVLISSYTFLIGKAYDKEHNRDSKSRQDKTFYDLQYFSFEKFLSFNVYPVSSTNKDSTKHSSEKSKY